MSYSKIRRNGSLITIHNIEYLITQRNIGLIKKYALLSIYLAQLHVAHNILTYKPMKMIVEQESYFDY